MRKLSNDKLPMQNKKMVGAMKSRSTKRALDRRDSSPFLSIFLASGLYYSQAESCPAHLRLTQAVRRMLSRYEYGAHSHDLIAADAGVTDKRTLQAEPSRALHPPKVTSHSR